MRHRHIIGAIAVSLTLGGTVWAQQPGGPPPGGPGGPRGPRMPMPDLTLATAPPSALAAYLGLTDAQRAKVEGIVEGLREKMRTQRPRPPAPPEVGEEGAPRQPPSREEMEKRRAEMDRAVKGADDQIAALLTADQRAKAPELLVALTALRSARIWLEAAPKLRLTADQIRRLAALGKDAAPDRINALLTAEQREIAAANRMPMRGPGGPGGPGGRGGRFGPPPFAGPDGPGDPPPGGDVF